MQVITIPGKSLSGHCIAQRRASDISFIHSSRKDRRIPERPLLPTHTPVLLGAGSPSRAAGREAPARGPRALPRGADPTRVSLAAGLQVPHNPAEPRSHI